MRQRWHDRHDLLDNCSLRVTHNLEKPFEYPPSITSRIPSSRPFEEMYHVMKPQAVVNFCVLPVGKFEACLLRDNSALGARLFNVGVGVVPKRASLSRDATSRVVLIHGQFQGRQPRRTCSCLDRLSGNL